MAADGADVIFKLTRHGAVDGPVAGIVHARRHLVRHRAAIDVEPLDRQHADVVEVFEDAPVMRFDVRQRRRRRDRPVQHSVAMFVLGQRIDHDRSVAAARRDSGYFPPKRDESFEDQRSPAERGPRRLGVRRRPQHRLTLAVVAVAPRLQHGGQADRGDRPIEIGARVDGGERRRRDAEALKIGFLDEPILRDLERPRRREHRHALRQPARRLDRHILEFVSDDVGRPHEVIERLEVVELAADRVADLAGARVGRGVVRGAADAEGMRREGDHAAELPAAEDAEFHGVTRGSGWSKTSCVWRRR